MVRKAPQAIPSPSRAAPAPVAAPAPAPAPAAPAPVPAAVAVPAAPAEVKEALKVRLFYVSHSSVGLTGGKYCSKTPEAAARKAGAKLFKKLENQQGTEDVAETEIVFRLQERADETAHLRGAARNIGPERVYSVSRKPRAEVKVIPRGDKDITYRFDYKVVAVRHGDAPAPVEVKDKKPRATKSPLAKPKPVDVAKKPAEVKPAEAVKPPVLAPPPAPKPPAPKPAGKKTAAK